MNKPGVSLSLILAGIILTGMVFSIGACSSLSVDKNALFAGHSGKVYLPLNIRWIVPILDQKEQDTYRPVENGIPTIDGNQVFVGNHHGELFCLDRKSGGVLWRFKAYGGLESAPVVYGENILLGDQDGNLYSLRRSDGFALWTYKVQGAVMGHITIHRNMALFATTYNRIYAINADDGSWIWTHQRALPEGFSIRGVSTPVTDGEFVYAGLADGYLVAVDIRRGREVWKNLLQKGERFIDVDATPVLDGNRIYVAGFDGALYCLKKEDGEVEWKFGHGGISRVVLDQDRLFFANADGFIFAVKSDTGKELWKFDVREEDNKKSATPSERRKLRVPTAPVQLGSFIISASSSGYLYALESETGKMLWKYFPGYGVASEVVKEGNELYFLSNSSMLYKMEPGYQPPPII